MPTLKARLYMDTICSHSWTARIQINRLRREYGHLLDFDYIVYPLFSPDTEIHLRDWSSRWWLHSHWAEVSEYGGEPIATSMPLENVIRTTFLAGEAYLAARKQGIAGAHRYLERLQLGVMAQRQRVCDLDVLYRLAQQAGLDADQLMRDLDEVRASGALKEAVAAAREKGIRSRPTLVLTNAAGQEYQVVGPQPYQEYVRAVELLLAEAAPPFTRVGGRILGYDDLDVLGARAAESGVNFEVSRSNGLPSAPKHESTAAVRFLRIQSGHPPLDLLGQLYRAGVRLVTAYGRGASLGDAPISLLGVRAEGADAADAVQRSLHLLGRLLAEAGVDATPATPAERDWVTGLPARAASPVVLQFLPARPRSTDPLWKLPSDFALITVSDPIPLTVVEAKAASLLEAQRRYESQLTQPEFHPQALALVESIAMRKGHYERWHGSAPVGMWRTFACLLASGDPSVTRAGAEALRSVYFDPEQLSPVAVQPVQADTTAHIAEHIQTFTLCDERWLHGADWWNTNLTGEELSRYIPGLFRPD